MNTNSNNGQSSSTAELISVTKADPCPHCGKPDWCYSKGSVTVCNREQPPATGWYATSKSDVNGKLYYALTAEKKPAERTAKSKSGSQKPVTKTIPASIPTGLKLLKLPAPQQGPEPQKPKFFPKDVPADALQINYSYSPTQEVSRWQWLDPSSPKGRAKTCRQNHIDGDGKQVWTKGDSPWPAYRLDEVIKTLGSVPNNEPVAVLMLEGEPNVELARSHSIAALTMQGSNWNHSEMSKTVDVLQATGKQIVLVMLRDNDDTGIKKASEVQSLCNWALSVSAGIPCLIVDPVAIYPGIPDKGDIQEILENMDIEEFIQRLEAEIHAAATEEINDNSLTPPPRTREDVVRLSESSSVDDYIPDTAPTALQNFVQKAEDALFGDGLWVSIGSQLYHSVGSHYELQPEGEVKRRIGDWLNTYSEKVKGVWVHNRAKSNNVAEIWNWVVARTAVDPNKINPDGLNCSNGVVKINPDGSHSLVPHNPSQVYTYVGGKYDPDIDPTDCDRLLECLEPQQREIFIRTAAAALNLKLVRSKLTGKGVKGLLCFGDGSNGKDTLRAVLAAVFGRGMTPKSLSDFKAYDGGRKFTLAGLEGGICNWASENASNVSLDNLQSLKQFITGDPIDIERKGKDSYEYKPTAIFLANCNKLPSITGGTAAIDDRYGILSFKKTYKRGAVASQGELEADPRFKDDENFILERIAPALLNKMLERFPLLLVEGIDYKATREAMREAQEESRHLWQFAREVGLEFHPEGKVYIGDLYKILEDWYQENGWLTIDNSGTKIKKSWEAESPYDSPVKKSQDLYLRLRELFPKIERRIDTQERKGHKLIFGLKLANPSQPSQLSYTERVSSQPPSQLGCLDGCDETLSQSQGCDGCDENPKNPTILELCNTIAKLTLSDKQKLTELLTGNPVDNPVGNPVSSPFTEICNSISQLTDDEWQKLVERRTQLQRQPQPQPQPEQPTPPTQPKTVTLKKGVRVRYVGDDANCVAQYGKLDLVVDEINKHRQVACLKPDGSFTTWLNSRDLRAISD